MSTTPFAYLAWRNIGPVTPLMQAVAIATLYLCTVLLGYIDYLETGLMFGYPLSISILFVPIYEEVIFRGIIFRYLEEKSTLLKAIVATSILFGLWHLKNIFFLSPDELVSQVIYTSVIISPIFCYITWKTKTIWPAVILHYLNNLAAPFSWIVAQNFL